MTTRNIQDNRNVDRSLHDILNADAGPDDRARAIRTMFVETLDFDRIEGNERLVPLSAAGDASLPADARLLARRDGFSVLYIPLDDTANNTAANHATDRATDNRVRASAAVAAARVIANLLADEPILLFTNRDGDQLHLIYPDLSGSRPRLQRMVAHRGQPNRTVVQQIARLWQDYGELGKSMGEAVRNAFSVEPVTRDFFAAYRNIFERAKSEIGGFNSGEEEQKHVFTQTLFNRLMFVYFLSRKGWLTFNGKTDYLNALWDDYKAKGDPNSFYSVRLYNLFFSGLNNSQSVDLRIKDAYMASLIGDVPFLNGGLFEETDLDRRDDITVPDTLIQRILTGLFDRFNFTVMESTPFDVEVAVDPEMLGKVFEELVTERHASGAYYTPRPVVSFMCREALKGYLEGQDTGADAVALAAFVDRHDTAGFGVAQARNISRALEAVTVVDPACGSGAYLLGMMQELIELQNTLFNVGVDPKSQYDLKLDIIRRNLYGVDLDGFAVNIAMLRLWLSLAIDYEGDDPQPLPNLDFKVLCGDSLLGPDPSVGLSARDDETAQVHMSREPARLERLENLKAQFMRATDANEKDWLRNEVEAIKVELRQAMGDGAPVPERALDWQAEFAEVIFGKQGFDIAIANPPYVHLRRLDSEQRRAYDNVGFITLARMGDIYQIFFERGCQLLRPGQGILAYITSNSWLKADYGKPLRRYFSENHTPLSLLELGKDVFEAIVDSSVLMLRSGGAAQSFQAVDMDRVESADFPPSQELWGQVNPDGDSPWSVLSRTEQSIIGKMREKGIPLTEWDVAIHVGIITGLNEAFIIDEATKKSLVSQDPKSGEIIRPVLRGRDIQRFQAEWAGLYLIGTHNGYGKVPAIRIDEYPAVKAHLDDYYDRLEKRQNKGRTPYNLRSCAHQGEFAKEKLLWIELAEEGRFAYDNSGAYGEATTFMMVGNSLKYLCALLNSTLIRWSLQQIAPTSGMGTFRWKKVYVETIPIPKISAEEQEPFIRLVDEILAAKAANATANTEHLEWQLDRLVYNLYGLTEAEDTTIERTLGLIHQTDEEEDAALLRAMEESDINDRVSLDEVLEILRVPDAS